MLRDMKNYACEQKAKRRIEYFIVALIALLFALVSTMDYNDLTNHETKTVPSRSNRIDR